MSLTLNLDTTDLPSGWVLVGARLGRQGWHYSSSLRVHRHSSPGQVEEIPLPVFPDGSIDELVELPDVARLDWQLPDGIPFEQRRLAIRRVSWVERTCRMAHRVVRTYARLPDDQRSKSGLTLWRALFDLPGAYRIAARYPLFNYPDWVARFDTLREQDIPRIHAHLARLAARPHFHLLLAAAEGGAEAVRATLASLRGQFYSDFTCTVVDGAGALGAAFDPDVELKSTGSGSRVVAREGLVAWLAGFNASLGGRQAGEWVMLLRAGDTLPAHALYWFACEAQARPDAAIVYSDDDMVDAEGRRGEPRFKPDWSLAHLQSTHYVGAAAILRGSAVAAAGGVRLDCCRHGNYDLLLRVIDSAGERVAHVPAVLLHRAVGTRAGSAWEDPRWCARSLGAHLARNGVAAEVVQTRPGCRRVRHHLPAVPPLVSIIVPTRDEGTLLRQCVESVLEKSTYSRFEILVVDNQSAEPGALAYLGELSRRSAVRLLRYDRSFNYSAINNFAVRQAQGEMLCLLNNDTEVISPDWLEEMAGHLLQSRVGAVGARLLYPDGRVQHGGVAVGPGGCADHLHADLARAEPGYCRRAVIAQELSAVTAACMLTWKHLYERLGGLNERALPVAFNDVDYCLRVQEAGYRVVYAADAELHHHESASRGIDSTWRERRRAAREINYMRAQWRERMRHDPYYNPNLSYEQPNFTLNWRPRVAKPWL